MSIKLIYEPEDLDDGYHYPSLMYSVMEFIDRCECNENKAFRILIERTCTSFHWNEKGGNARLCADQVVDLSIYAYEACTCGQEPLNLSIDGVATHLLKGSKLIRTKEKGMDERVSLTTKHGEMNWAIYDAQPSYDSDSSDSDSESDDEGVGDCEPTKETGDLAYTKTSAPDGIHKAYFQWLNARGTIVKGIKVKNGHFVLKPTLKACLYLCRITGYWGRYLEELEWHANRGYFVAEFGS